MSDQGGNSATALATVELRDLVLPAEIGAYGPGDVVPEAHLLDLTLGIDPGLVMVARDGMAGVFDYDPLVAEIERLARGGPYETQEWLMHRIVGACAAHREIDSVAVCLKKRPVAAGSGVLGVRLVLDSAALAAYRATSG